MQQFSHRELQLIFIDGSEVRLLITNEHDLDGAIDFVLRLDTNPRVFDSTVGRNIRLSEIRLATILMKELK